MVEEKR